MKWLVSSACFFSVLFFTVYAAPASTGLQGSSSGNGGIGNILQNIDIAGLLQGVNSFVKLVGAFCPPLSQVLDNVIQNVTSTAFRVFGRIILRGGGLGGGSTSGGSSGSGSGGQKVNVVLPTFPPDEDYDDEDESASTSTTGSVLAQQVNNAVITDAPNTDDSANTIAKRHIRIVREAATAENAAVAAAEDQTGAESAPQPGQELNDVADDQDRNKRYSPFGGGDDDGHAGAGSGNFLFDIIRLVAGSGATEDSDDHEAGGVAEVDVKSAEVSAEGIPGPITRLFVIANRGLANLVQDLILRLAQTSERLVNFKARLITALI